MTKYCIKDECLKELSEFIDSSAIEEVESLDFAKAILARAKCSSDEAEEIASATGVFNDHDQLINEDRAEDGEGVIDNDAIDVAGCTASTDII